MAAKTADQLSELKLNGNAENKTASKSKPNGTTADASDQDSDDNDEDAAVANGAENTAATGEKKKKKKKKPKKKKTGTAGAKVQSDPPRVPVSQLFPNNSYPVGQEVEYLNDQQYRTTSEEKRHLDRSRTDFLTEYRQGAEIHRQTRAWAQKNIKPGMNLHEIANGIEDCTRALTGHQGLEEGDGLMAGVGFPTGLSINHCAAHYTPNSTSKTWVLAEKDVLKVDFGVHINQRIVVSRYCSLLLAMANKNRILPSP